MDFFSRFREFCAKFLRSMKSPKGYIAIIMTAFIPLVLLGLRYFLDTRTLKNLNLYKRGDNTVLFKKCAAEAALEVAKHWNPGLTMSQQLPSMYRIADKIYNESPTYHAGVMGEAIGAETDGISTAPSMKQITMDTVTPTYARFDVKSATDAYDKNLPLYALYSKVYNLPLDPKLTLLNYEPASSPGGPRQTIGGTTIHSSGVRITMPSEYVESGQYMNNESVGGMNNITSTSNGEAYLIRSNSDDENKNDQKLRIQVAGDDMIKVVTDTDVNEQYQDVGCAKPAYCNVDIILTIPTNMAANNVNNRDSNTPTTGAALNYTDATSLSADYKSTPIYEIAGAYQGFLKHFMFTRGVGVGLIPYDANIGIPEARVTEWTIAPPAFLVDNWPLSPYLRRAFLYGSSADGDDFQGDDNEISDDHGPAKYSMNAIFSRAGVTTTESAYGGNTLFKGDILSNADPKTGNSDKFIRQWYKPAQFINLLNMKSEVATEELAMHPFHIAEITNNVDKIFNLLSVIGPHDGGRKNVSNFVFLPIVWANNLLQDWTADKYDSGFHELNHYADYGLLTPSKIKDKNSTNNSKHAVILLVNKPDFFKENELTYLGFSDDFSEVPMVESDKICFDTDYSNTSLKFADGTAFDGTIQGAKKILKYETKSGTIAYDSTVGYYQQTSETASAQLTFPRKHLVKLVVAPKFTGNNSGKHKIASGQSLTYTFSGPILPADDNTTAGYGTEYSSSQGANFRRNLSPYKVKYELENATITSCKLYGQVLRDYVGQYGRNQPTFPPLILANGVAGQIAEGNTAYTYGINTVNIGQFKDPCLVFAKTPVLRVGSSSEYGSSVKYFIANLSNNAVCYALVCHTLQVTKMNGGGGYAYTVAAGAGNSWYWASTASKAAQSTPLGAPGVGERAVTFTPINDAYDRVLQTYILNCASLNTQAGSITTNTNPFNNAGVYLLNNWICFNGDAKLEVTVTAGTGGGYVTFFNDRREEVTASITVNNTTYSNITEEKEIYVEATSISGSSSPYSIELKNMQNIRLVSAEITNRAYKKDTSVRLEGTTNGTGKAYLYTKVKKPVTLKTNFEWPPIPRCSGTINFNSDWGNKITSGDLTYSTTSGTMSYDSDWECYKTTGKVGADSRCSAKGKLVFPGGKLLKIVVEPAITWQNLGATNLKTGIANTYWYNMGSLGTTNNKIQAISENGIVAESTDGTTFTKVNDVSTANARISAINPFTVTADTTGLTKVSSGWYTNGVYNIFMNANNTNNTTPNLRYIIGGNVCGVTKFGTTRAEDVWGQDRIFSVNGICVAFNDTQDMNSNTDWARRVYMSFGNQYYVDWTRFGPKEALNPRCRVFGYGKGLFVAGANPTRYSADFTRNWTDADYSLKNAYSTTDEWYGGTFVNDRFYAVHFNGYVLCSLDGRNWRFVTKGISSDNSLGGTGYRNITYWKGSLWCYKENGSTCFKGHFGTIKFTNITSSDLTSADEYAVTGRKTFFIAIDKIKNNASELTFDMTNIRLISAELIPNDYTTTKPECSLSAPTNGTGACTIITNVKQPMTLKVNKKEVGWTKTTSNTSESLLSVAYGNGKYVAVGRNGTIITSTDGVNWSISNSGVSGYLGAVCYADNKFVVTGSGDDSGIVLTSTDGTNWSTYTPPIKAFEAVCYGDGKFVMGSIYGVVATSDFTNWTRGTTSNNSTNIHAESICYANGVFVCSGQNGHLFSSANGVNWTSHSLGSGWWSPVVYGNGKFIVFSNQTDTKNYISTDGSTWTQYSIPQGWYQDNILFIHDHFWMLEYNGPTYTSVNGINWSEGESVDFDLAKKTQSTIYANGKYVSVGTDGHTMIKSSDSCISYYNPLRGADVVNRMLDDQTITIEPHMYNYVQSGNKYTITLTLKDAEVSDLHFIDEQGICEIIEDMTPLQTEPSYITYKAPDGTTNITQYPAAGETITIDPETHYYEKVGNEYKITLNVQSNEPTTATRLSDPALKDPSAAFEFEPLRVPQMSRYIDFNQKVSNNKPYISDTNLISLHDNFGMKWDAINEVWITKPNENQTVSAYNSVYWKQINGNGYVLLDSSSSRKISDWTTGGFFNISGLFRNNIPFKYNAYSDFYVNVYDADVYPAKFEIAGWTLPINTMLYYGMKGTKSHGYAWQSNSVDENTTIVDENAITMKTYDASEACKNVTIDACDKLKTDYGADIRVYVIKYRKQTQYRLTSSSAMGAKKFSYDYIDNCASDKGGGVKYAYDVSTKEALEKTLEDIAKDIKKWAEYKPAELVATDDIPADPGGFF